MKGNFTLGLLEVCTYLIPGMIVLSILALIYYNDIFDQAKQTTWLAVLSIFIAYLIGHALTVVSYLLVYVRKMINKLIGCKYREPRYPYYPALRDKLRGRFGSNISRADEYLFSIRLVMESYPSAAELINRQYALSLFSRNTSMALFVVSIILIKSFYLLSMLSMSSAIVFYVRYVQFERALEATVFRMAYIYFTEPSSSQSSVIG